MYAARDVLLVAGALVGLEAGAQPQIGTVVRQQKISGTEGGFPGVLDDHDQFGTSIAYLGDLNGDGYGDLAVGAPFDDDGGPDRGAVWILFLDGNDRVFSYWKISDLQGGLTSPLSDGDLFGGALVGVGDLDGDTVPDVAVGSRGANIGGPDRGAVLILFLNRNGTVKSEQRISAIDGGFSGVLDDEDFFGTSLTTVDDLDGDGVPELAVGAQGDDDGGSGSSAQRGAVWILFLERDGTVKTEQKISQTTGGFVGSLDDNDFFGQSVACLGDLNDDGAADLAVGAMLDDDGGAQRGAVWILSLNPDGSVNATQKISSTQGGFTGALDDDDQFGVAVAGIQDLDMDGIEDVAIGASSDDDGGDDHGTVWLLFLNPDGTVRAHSKINDTAGGFTGPLNSNDRFGGSLSTTPPVPVGAPRLFVGATGTDDGGPNRGAVWTLSHSCPIGAVAYRNGAGVNPATLFVHGPPILGSPWRLDVNCVGHAPSAAALYFYASPANGVIVQEGEILVGGPAILSRWVTHSGTTEQITFAIPLDPALCGRRASGQALCLGAPAGQLSNAYDILIGH